MELELLDRPFPFSQSVPRQSGTHLSDVLDVICAHIYKGKREAMTEEERILMELGFIWERALEMAWRDLLGIRPPQICLDNIWLSPDYVKYGDEIVITESKLTKKSSRDFDPSAQMRWIMQIKAYCYSVGAKTAELHVLFVNGDYKGYLPKYRVWKLSFTELELEENWQMIINNAKAAGLV